MRKWLFALVLVVLSVMPIWAWEWGDVYSGIVHVHSTYSDGDRTPEMLRGAVKGSGSTFFVGTDHIEQINSKTKLGGVTGDFGYDRYLADFEGGEPIGICGTEVITGRSHFLVFGEKEKMRAFFAIDRGKTQQEKINAARALDLMVVAAHPNSDKYPFDVSQAEGLSGVEFYNEDHAGYIKTRDWYLKLLKDGKDIFVTAGCDSHSSIDPTKFDLTRWGRKTWLNIMPDIEHILWAFRNGITFATCDGVNLRKNCFRDPDFRWWPYYTNIGFGYDLKFEFEKPLKSAKTIRLYLDSEVLTDSVRTIPKGSTKYDYSYRNPANIRGRHYLILELEDLYIASPERYDFVPAL